MGSRVWLVLATGDTEEGGWVINGLFSTRRLALEYAATVSHEVYAAEFMVDQFPHWAAARKAAQQGDPGWISPVTRADLLAEGLEDELDVLHHDLGVARRAYDSALRAKYDGRATNEPELERAIRRKGDRVRELERELAVMQAEQRAADEAYEETM